MPIPNASQCLREFVIFLKWSALCLLGFVLFILVLDLVSTYRDPEAYRMGCGCGGWRYRGLSNYRAGSVLAIAGLGLMLAGTLAHRAAFDSRLVLAVAAWAIGIGLIGYGHIPLIEAGILTP